MGRNRPAKAVPFDGMVWRYLIIYIVNLLLLTNECQQRGSTVYALGVAHNTSHILQLSPRSLQLHIGMCLRKSLNGLVLSANAWFHQSCCSTKIAPPVPVDRQKWLAFLSINKGVGIRFESPPM